MASLLGSDLSRRERWFCIVACWPKAMVEAAIGAVPLSLVLDGKASAMTEENGRVILAIAVLSIVAPAPLGALGIQWGGRRLLVREDAES